MFLSRPVIRTHALGGQTWSTYFALHSQGWLFELAPWPIAPWFFFLFFSFSFFFCIQRLLGVRGLPPAERRLTLSQRRYLVSFRQLPRVEVFNIALISGLAFRIMANSVRSCFSRCAGKLGCCVRLFSQAMRWPFLKSRFLFCPPKHLRTVNRHTFVEGIIRKIFSWCVRLS